MKLFYGRACSSLCMLLYPASGMTTIKIECFVSQGEHVSFEHGMAEFVRMPNFTE